MTLGVIECHAARDQKIDFCLGQFNLSIAFPFPHAVVIQAQVDCKWAAIDETVDKPPFITTKVTVLCPHCAELLHLHCDLFGKFKQPILPIRSLMFAEVDT
ncbi:hypothetical protein D3C81_1317260 [compost metagenome]